MLWPMRLNVMLEPQEGLAYDDILAVARRAEELGFDGLFRSDHYRGTIGEGPVPSTDCWATLAGLARDTERITLGSLVSPVTFRPAGNLAKVAATVAQMAGPGRLVLGMGTGWMEPEHTQFGFPFSDTATRFRRLTEHLQVVRGLWDPQAETFTFDGEFEQLTKAVFAPKPDPAPRIIVGGQGAVKTPQLAARYADELNAFGADADGLRERRAILDRVCEETGRDPAEVQLSLMTRLLVGADDAEVDRRVEALHAWMGREIPRERLAATWVFGTPDQAVARLAELRDAGADAVMLQHLLHGDLDMLDLVATDVVPQLGGPHS
jgi:F420-dependent oxidoreductase-like protein